MTITTREPVGVVASIVPWNMPLMFLGYKIAAPLPSRPTGYLNDIGWLGEGASLAPRQPNWERRQAMVDQSLRRDWS